MADEEKKEEPREHSRPVRASREIRGMFNEAQEKADAQVAQEQAATQQDKPVPARRAVIARLRNWRA